MAVRLVLARSSAKALSRKTIVVSPACRSQLPVPGHDAQRQRLHLGGGDLRGEADEKRACADAVDGLAGDGPVLDWHRQVESEFEQQFKQDVRLGAVGFQMLD